MRELFVNGRSLDLDANTVIAITYQVNDISELENRQANYTNSFTIPATQKNRVNLGFSDKVETNSGLPYRKLRADYFQNGIQIIQNGVALIDGFDGVNFNITIYSGIYSFFEIVSERTLREIDFSELNHNYTAAGVASVNNAYTDDNSDVCLPVMDWGAPVIYNSNYADIKYLQPCIRFSYIINKIADSLGYTFDGDIFNEEIYKKLALTVNTGEFYNDEDFLISRSARLSLQAQRNTAIECARYNYNGGTTFGYEGVAQVNLVSLFRNSTNVGGLYGSTNGNIFYQNSGYDIVKDITSYADEYTWKSQNINRSCYIATDYGVLDINIEFKAINMVMGDASEVGADGEVYKSNVIVVSKFQQEVYINGIGGGISTGTKIPETFLVEDSFSLQVAPGDKIFIWGYVLGLFNPFITYTETSSGLDYNSAILSFSFTNAMQLGNEINYNSIIPDLKFKDIIRSFCNMFALTVSEENEIVTFTKFKDIVNNDTEDWSLKIDTSKNIPINYEIGKYAINNDLKYLPNNFTNGYGDGVLIVDNEKLNERISLFELIFSSTLQKSIGFISNRIKTLTPEELATYNAFALNTNYTVGDKVRVNIIIYECVNNHLATAFFSNNWKIADDSLVSNDILVSSLPRYTSYYAEPYIDTQEYSLGDEVSSGGFVYTYINITPTTGTPVNNALYWEIRLYQFEQTETHPTSIVLINKAAEGNGVISNLVYSIRFGNGTSIASLNDVPYASFYDNNYSLDFNFLIDNYYSELNFALNKLKYISCYIRLKEQDVNNLDFTKPKFISLFGNKFYLNKIEDYIDGSQPVRCELIKI